MFMNAETLNDAFAHGVSYDAVVASGDPGHHAQWHQRHDALALDSEQMGITQGFTRTMKILCLTG